MSSYEQIIHNALVLAGRPDGYSRAFDQHRRAPRFPLVVPFRFAQGSYPLQSLPEALSSRRANQSRLTFAYCHEGKAFLRTFHHEYASMHPSMDSDKNSIWKKSLNELSKISAWKKSLRHDKFLPDWAHPFL